VQTLYLAADPPSRADWMTAWGTLLTALLAAVGLIITIVLAAKDRRRADSRLQTERTEAAERLKEERDRYEKDLARANAQLAEERARADAERLRQYNVRLLADVVEQYARFQSNAGSPESGEAIARLNVMLRMVPDGTATLLKKQFTIPLTALDGRRLGDISSERGEPVSSSPPGGWIFDELAANAKEIVAGTT
jgi:hypothetical protein